MRHSLEYKQAIIHFLAMTMNFHAVAIIETIKLGRRTILPHSFVCQETSQMF